MDKQTLIQTINDAQWRADNRKLPLEMRIHSYETISLCLMWATANGWTLQRHNDTWSYSHDD